MASDISPDRIQTSGELFEAVQQSRVFPDSKQFVDMVPTDTPEEILTLWKTQRNKPGFDLAEFIANHFELPDTPAKADEINIEQKHHCRDHIRELWPMLFRQADSGDNPHSSLIPLPNPYVVPGGRFREIYYWDSYFTARGLIADGHREMALNMAKNFRYMIRTCGHIPNGNRVYYLSRSQPPFFMPMISMLADEFGHAIISDFYDEAVQEYRFWSDETGEPDRRALTITDANGNSHHLNRYWDDKPSPREESWIEDVTEFKSAGSADRESFYRHIRAACESGWDFSSRWLADRSNLSSIETTSLLPVDLNTLLWYAETKLAEWSDSLGHSSQSDRFRELAAKRKASINQLMWDAGRGFYFDYHIINNRVTDCYSLAAVYPLYFKLADHSQAEAVAEQLERHFLKDGGLLTTTETTGQQWDAPNGWAPLQWLAVIGLENYGMSALADEIRTRWLALNERVYKDTGKMVEKYNVADIDKKGGGGEYPLQDGFGWTNGVFSALSEQ